MQHVFIVGAKSLGAYGGYETFVNKLTEYHQDNKELKYHVACKKNGDGHMDENMLDDVKKLNNTEFIYHNAHCFKISVPDFGAAQAIYYDVAALNYCCKYITENNIKHPLIYILACRIGPLAGYYQKKIHKLNGKIYLNPDGHEWARKKWNFIIRKYWKISERFMIKHSDVIVCDSLNIEKYIQKNYNKYHPITTYIAYGSETRPSLLSDDDKTFTSWLDEKKLSPNNYYLIVGRFVPENNFETMIREFMKSKSKKDLAIITTANDSFIEELEKKLHFKTDSRIKFVGTVYNAELLKKIRENAFGYLHGHEVGGTNPSLLEALGSTKLNLLLDVGFNREVAEDVALYWNKKEGNLAKIIQKAEKMSSNDIIQLGLRAQKRIGDAYSWEYIVSRYAELFQE